MCRCAQFWKQKIPAIREGDERAAAATAYEEARQVYRQVLSESDED